MAIPLVARIGLMVLLKEGGGWKARREERDRLFECAKYRADELGRPLVIIGDSGIDPSCVRVGGVQTANNSCVVYCCYGLERVPDIEAAWSEIMRVAGSPSNVFVAHLRGGIPSLAPDVRWKIESAPPHTPGLHYRQRVVSLTKIKPY